MPAPYAEVFLANARNRRRLPGPEEVRVIQAEYSHEVAILTYPYDASLQKQLTRNKPVAVKWGWALRTSEFDGTVHHVVATGRADDPVSQRKLTVVCVGASDVLNQPAFSQYRGTRVDAAVSELARRGGFSTLVEKHPYAWKLLQQEGESSWSFLVECAKKIGWTLYVRNTDLRCHSRVIRTASASVFRDRGLNGVDAQASVYAFQMIQAETLAGQERKRDRATSGVDSTGTAFTVRTDQQSDLSGARATAAQLGEYRDLEATSVGEADALLRGEQELNRHYLRAKTTVSGDSSVGAASAVRLVGIDKDNDGYWYVTRAEHVITHATYRLALELGKDSVGDPAGPNVAYRVPPGETSSRAAAYDGVAPSGRGTPEAVWDGTRWRAASATERVLPAAPRPVSPTRTPVPLVSTFRGSNG